MSAGPITALEPPSLLRANPAGLLASASAPLRRAAYGLTYALRPLRGSIALQRVETRVTFSRGDRVLADYRSRYWEFFRFGDDPDAVRLDRHDFDLERDGWGPGAIGRLLARHGLPVSGGLARLRCEKAFLLGPGELVGDATPRHVLPDGGSFGYLAEVEGERASTSLLLDAGAVDASAEALPSPGPAIGRGRLLEGARWSASERLEFLFATLEGQVDREAYRH